VNFPGRSGSAFFPKKNIFEVGKEREGVFFTCLEKSDVWKNPKLQISNKHMQRSLFFVKKNL